MGDRIGSEGSSPLRLDVAEPDLARDPLSSRELRVSRWWLVGDVDLASGGPEGVKRCLRRILHGDQVVDVFDASEAKTRGP